MAWDPNRPVPWRRLAREWLVYVAIMAVLFVLFFRDDNLIGIIAGLLASGPLYLGFGAVLAKFGYQRPALRRDLRAQSATTSDPSAATGAPRPKPAPTKRTGGGSSRPGGKRRR